MITRQELQRRLRRLSEERINTPVRVADARTCELHGEERKDFAAYLGIEEHRIRLQSPGMLVVDDRGLPDEPQADDRPAAGPWISVEERMPPSMLCVLVWDDEDGEHVAQWMAPDAEGTGHVGYWLSSDGDELDSVTHWALVTGPKETP